MQEFTDLQKILDHSGMKLISKESLDNVFAQKAAIINTKNRASNLLLLSSTILFSFSSLLSLCTFIYVRGILPEVNNEIKNDSVAAISPPIAKIEENSDVKILQQEVAAVEVVKPAIKDKSRKKKVEQKEEPISVVEQKEEPISVVEQPEVEQKEDPNAVVKQFADGGKVWYLNGKLHREGGPAIEWPDGTKAWYLNGKLHREGGPAVERSDGGKAWYLDGVLQGVAIERSNSGKAWYLDGLRQQGVSG